MNFEGNPLPDTGQAALKYSGMGFFVFPVPPGTKKSHKSAAHSDGRAWGATLNTTEIMQDWAHWPDANVGVMTGPKSDIFVLDLDRKNGVDGIAWMEEQVAKHGELPRTVEATTPSGGRHIWFNYPKDFDVKTCEGLIAPGVDVRGKGGMVVAPPSMKPDGGLYQWTNPPHLCDTADAPEWLLDLLPRYGEVPAKVRELHIDTGGSGYGEKALREEIARVWAAPEGTRNGKLNRAAFALGQLVAGGELDGHIVTDRLASAAQAAGLDLNEAVATINSGMAAGMAQPRIRQAPGTGQSPAVDDAPQRHSQFYSAADLDGKPVPQRQWLVHDMIPMNTVTLFSGDGGTGKSLLALQLAASVAAGRAWINEPVAKGRALFLSAEDDEDELHMRLADICRATNLQLADLHGLTMRSLAGENALLATEVRSFDAKMGLVASALFNEIEARAEEERPSLIVLDTLADMFPANENDRAAARQFIGILRGLAIRQKCAVILLSHPSLTGLNSGTGTSGSTGWNNSVRSRLYLERVVQDSFEADPDKRVLSTKKSNYGRVGAERSLTWEQGVFVRADEPQGLDKLAAGSKAERVFLSLLRSFSEQGRRVNAAAGARYAPAVFAAHPDADGCTKRAFRAALEALLSRGVIVNLEEGPPSRRTSFIALGEK